MRLVSVSQMNQLEKEANQNGLTYAEMMARAGYGLAEIIHKRFGSVASKKITGLIGSGNNGGDTLVALTHLAKWGWETHACLVRSRKANDGQLKDHEEEGGNIHLFQKNKKSKEDTADLIQSSDILLDGILGTGSKLPLRDEVKEAMSFIHDLKDLPGIMIAVDCPSGVDCDTGEAADECLPAHMTMCMAAVKKGLLKFPAIDLAGEIISVDIGLPDDLPGWQSVLGEVADDKMVARLLPNRPANAHKGTFGTTLVLAGSVNYPGAAMLAIQGAYRVGCGLVMGAVPEAIYDAIVGHIPESTWLVMPHTLGAFNKDSARIAMQYLDNADVLLIGPGWGMAEETFECLKQLITPIQSQSGRTPLGFTGGKPGSTSARFPKLPPLVIDADALKLLAKIDGWQELISSPAVLTPHPGEMAILTGLDISEIQHDREEVAIKYSAEWNQTVVLKGAVTVVASPDGRFTLIPVATSALATAGTGDVLAGMIAGFLAQGLATYEAGISAAWLHAQAGLLASRELGQPASIVAGDVVRRIPEAIKKTAGL